MTLGGNCRASDGGIRGQGDGRQVQRALVENGAAHAGATGYALAAEGDAPGQGHVVQAEAAGGQFAGEAAGHIEKPQPRIDRRTCVQGDFQRDPRAAAVDADGAGDRRQGVEAVPDIVREVVGLVGMACHEAIEGVRVRIPRRRLEIQRRVGERHARQRRREDDAVGA